MDRQAWLRERRQTAEERYGKYFAMVTDSGRRVVGTDQSTGMLGRARARFPAVPLERLIRFEEAAAAAAPLA